MESSTEGKISNVMVDATTPDETIPDPSQHQRQV